MTYKHNVRLGSLIEVSLRNSNRTKQEKQEEERLFFITYGILLDSFAGAGITHLHMQLGGNLYSA